MQVILQFELGNFELAEYLLRSTYRYLQRQNTLAEYEKVILDYIKKSTRKVDRAGFVETFKELHTKLIEEVQNPTGKLPLGMYEVIFWLETKIDNIPMGELMKKKLAERPKLEL